MKTKTKFIFAFILIFTAILTPVAAFAIETPETITPTNTPEIVLPVDSPDDIPDEPPHNSLTPDGATPPNIATADLIINDFQDGQTGKQFMAFKTSSGKIFYLIIDHDKTNDNVYLLTEVGENDLLNIVKSDNGSSASNNLIINPVVPGGDDTAPSDSSTPDITKDTGNSGMILIVVLILGAGGGAFYYFKIKNGKGKLNVSDYDFDNNDDYEQGDDE